MSIRVMTAVWADSNAKGSALLLELAIADWADDNGRAFPSIASMASKVRLSERATRYLIRGLIRDGELVVLEEAKQHSTPRYTVRPGGQSLPLSASQGGNRLPSGGQRVAP